MKSASCKGADVTRINAFTHCKLGEYLFFYSKTAFIPKLVAINEMCYLFLVHF